MIVAGDHCMNDMASDEEDSWKSVLLKEGFKVKLYTRGMGENPLVKEIFAQHVEDVIFDRYRNMGKTKKGQK
jgi:sirohydrochlorin cobaltochelatase